MPIPFFDDDEPDDRDAYDRWMDSTNEGRGFDPAKAAKFIGPIRSAIDPAHIVGRQLYICEKFGAVQRAQCPEWASRFEFLKGVNEERADLASAIH